ncbi:flippase [Candidatus Peregrinibacteria bacterium]|nr:flippase [Candidatus Peregrinibacteria bacterium]
MSIARKILENTFVQVLGKLLTAALSIVVLKIISGYLGTSGYGDYTTVYQFLAFFGIIADFGIYTITVREMSRDESRIPMILGNIMGLRTFLAVVAMGLAVLTVFLVPTYNNTLIPLGVLIATLATFFTLLNGTVSSVLQVYLKMHYATVSLVVGKIVSVVYMGWVAYIAFTGDLINGFYHLLWAGVLGNLVMFLITAYYVRRFCKITYQFDLAYWKKVFFTSLPFGVALILNTIYFRLDVILMTFILPHSQSIGGEMVCASALCSDTEIGLYGVAMRMLEMLVIIPVYFMNSVLPVMTRYIEEQSEKIRSLMQYSFDFLVATGLPILVGSFILARPIIHFISDPQFLSGSLFTFGSDIAVRILMFAMLFSFVNALFGFTLVVLNKQVRLMFINAGAVLFNLIGNILVIPVWGFRGAAITSTLSEAIILIFTYWMAQKFLGFHLSLRTFIRTLAAALVMGAVVWIGFEWMAEMWFIWQLAVLIPLGGLVYLLLMFKTKAITPEMMSLLRKK